MISISQKMSGEGNADHEALAVKPKVSWSVIFGSKE